MSLLEHSRDIDLFDSRELVEALDGLDSGDTGEAEDIAAIRAFFEEVSSYGGDTPEDGIGFIADYYFKEYAMELAEDIGLINDAGPVWPATCIDWERAARELRMDYTSVEVDGRTYWYR